MAQAGGMTVHATVELGVFQQGPLAEGTQFPLIDAHVAVHLISRFQEAVSEAIVDGIRRHEDAEGLERPPLPVELARNGDLEGIPGASLEQVRPTLGRETGGGSAAGTQDLPVRRGQSDIDRIGPLQGKIQRGDTRGNRHAGIIGINVGTGTGRNGMAGLRLAGCQHEDHHQDGQGSFHRAEESCR